MAYDRAEPYLHHPQMMIDPDAFVDGIERVRFVTSVAQFNSTAVYVTGQRPQPGDLVEISQPEIFGTFRFSVLTVQLRNDRIGGGGDGSVTGRHYWLCGLKFEDWI